MKAKRLIYNELCKDLSENDITILLGARQVGKTYLLREIEQYAKDLGKRTVYFDLEIPSDIRRFAGSEEQIFDLLTNSGDVVFLDEFHYLKNASHLFKAVYDSRAKVKIFASGSSSLEIHKHLKESLAGRRMVRKIFPLSIKEFKNSGLSCQNVLVEGSLPGLLRRENSQAREAYLANLLETYILKDIKSLIKEENVRAFNHLLYALAEHQSSMVSVASLAKEVGLTAKTIEKYLAILEQTYVCYALPSFSTNLANELKKSKKYFFYDLGIRNAIIKNFERDLSKRDDRGVLLESFVFLELLQKVSPTTSIYFWRTKMQNEVDFVKVVNRRPIPIEVKSGWNELKVPDGIKAFLDRYSEVSDAYVVSQNAVGEAGYKKAVVHFVSWDCVDQL